MNVTGMAHKGIQAFTAPSPAATGTWLGAEKPDHLTACNTVQSKTSAFCLKINICGKRQEILHEGNGRAKKHRTQHFTRFTCSHWSLSHACIIGLSRREEVNWCWNRRSGSESSDTKILKRFESRICTVETSALRVNSKSCNLLSTYTAARYAAS
jgi:hypothetical protein